MMWIDDQLLHQQSSQFIFIINIYFYNIKIIRYENIIISLVKSNSSSKFCTKIQEISLNIKFFSPTTHPKLLSYVRYL